MKTKQEFLTEARPLAEALLDFAKTEGKKYGITDARISISAGSSDEKSVEKGVVSESTGGTSYMVGVTLYAGDKMLSFRNNSLDANALKAAMLENMQAIDLVPGNPTAGLLDAKDVYKGPIEDLEQVDANPPSAEELLDYARKAEAATLAQPGIKGTRSAGISANSSHSLVLATNGQDHYEGGTHYQASVQAVAEHTDGSMEIDYDFSVAMHFNDMADPVKLGERAATNAVEKLGSTLPDTGKMPIVLSPEAAYSFFSAVFSAISGTALHRGTTFLKDKLGKQILSKGVTIVDDPRVKRGLGSQAVDTVGLESKKITFVDDGVLKSYMLDLKSSRQLGMDPIGREYGTTNVTVMPGDKTPDELMSDIKDGVYITGFSGGTVDVNSGVHSRQATGKLIKNGKVTDIAVSGFTVSGNLKDMFMAVAVANDTPKLPNTRSPMASPTTRINGLTIGGK